MTRYSIVQRYGNLSIILHWLMLTLFIGVYSCIEIKGLLPRGNIFKAALLGMHALFGMAIFTLVWVRLPGLTLHLPWC